jgi:4-hydroxybenzoate polyprenyltransferase
MTPLLKLLRPHQWSKNLLVLAGFIFGHGWNNPLLTYQVIIAVVAFTCVASSIYIFNDIMDRANDRLHPIKKLRPLACGAVNIFTASITAGLLCVAGLALSFVYTLSVGWFLLAYILLNIAYTLQLKYWIILDVFIVALGFLLRVLVGTTGIGIPPSPWLLLCTLLIALFLGFCKRRADMQLLATAQVPARLPHYSLTLLNTLITITVTGSILSYALYCLYQDQLFHHGLPRLIYTVPLVIYGLFRYLHLVDSDTSHRTGVDMARDMLRDRHLLIVAIIWLVSVVWLGIS